MASKVKSVLRLIGRRVPDPGAHMYHAADGVVGPHFGKDKRHRMRKALARQRMRATGMSDDLLGAKEVDGALENPHEAKV